MCMCEATYKHEHRPWARQCVFLTQKITMEPWVALWFSIRPIPHSSWPEGRIFLYFGRLHIHFPLPCCSYHRFISKRKIGAFAASVFGLELFLQISFFKSSPSRPAGGSCVFCCSLGACPGFMYAVVVVGVKQREQGWRSREKDGGGE